VLEGKLLVVGGAVDEPEDAKGILKPAIAEGVDDPGSSGVNLSFADFEGFSFSFSLPFPRRPPLILLPCPRSPPGFEMTFPARPPPAFMNVRFDAPAPALEVATV